MPMWLPPFNLRSMHTSLMTTKGNSQRICASMASPLRCIQTLRLESVMLVLFHHGYGGSLVIGIPIRYPLFLMLSSRCVRSKVTPHGRIV